MREFHDSFVGVEGAFDSAVGTVNLLVGRGINTTISSAVFHDNLYEIEPLIDLAEGLGVGVYRAALLVPVGKGKDLKLLSEEEQEELKFIMLGRKVGSPMNIILPDISDCHCGAGYSTLNIAPDGSILACEFLREPVGNIRNDSIKDILEKGCPYEQQGCPARSYEVI